MASYNLEIEQKNGQIKSYRVKADELSFSGEGVDVSSIITDGKLIMTHDVFENTYGIENDVSPVNVTFFGHVSLFDENGDDIFQGMFFDDLAGMVENTLPVMLRNNFQFKTSMKFVITRKL